MQCVKHVEIIRRRRRSRSHDNEQKEEKSRRDELKKRNPSHSFLLPKKNADWLEYSQDSIFLHESTWSLLALIAFPIDTQSRYSMEAGNDWDWKTPLKCIQHCVYVYVFWCLFWTVALKVWKFWRKRIKSVRRWYIPFEDFTNDSALLLWPQRLSIKSDLISSVSLPLFLSLSMLVRECVFV